MCTERECNNYNLSIRRKYSIIIFKAESLANIFEACMCDNVYSDHVLYMYSATSDQTLTIIVELKQKVHYLNRADFS